MESNNSLRLLPEDWTCIGLPQIIKIIIYLSLSFPRALSLSLSLSLFKAPEKPRKRKQIPESNSDDDFILEKVPKSVGKEAKKEAKPPGKKMRK